MKTIYLVKNTMQYFTGYFGVFHVRSHSAISKTCVGKQNK